MKQQKSTAQQSKRELSLNSMYFNRYLFIRYMTAIFFFFNLYWFILLLNDQGFAKAIPAVLLVSMTLVAIEQVSKYWRRSHNLPFAKVGYALQLLVNLLVLGASVTGHSAWFVPFLSGHGATLLGIAILLGIFICLFVGRKIFLIENDRDRYLQRISQFKTSLGH